MLIILVIESKLINLESDWHHSSRVVRNAEPLRKHIAECSQGSLAHYGVLGLYGNFGWLLEHLGRGLGCSGVSWPEARELLCWDPPGTPGLLLQPPAPDWASPPSLSPCPCVPWRGKKRNGEAPGSSKHLCTSASAWKGGWEILLTRVVNSFRCLGAIAFVSSRAALNIKETNRDPN